SEDRVHPFQFRRSHQRQVLVHENEEGDGERHIQSRHPAGNFKFLALTVIAIAKSLALRFIGGIGGYFFQRRIGGKLQRAEPQGHRVPQRHHPTDHRPAHPFMLLRRPFQRLAVSNNLTRRFAHRDAPGMRRTHHHALQHRLPADEGFLAALQSGQQLYRRQKTQDLPPTSHSHWMLFRGKKTPTCRLPQIGEVSSIAKRSVRVVSLPPPTPHTPPPPPN